MRHAKIIARIIVEHGRETYIGEDAKAIVLGISERYRANAALRRLERTEKRFEGRPERKSVAVAMLAVEERLVKAFWTIARQPLGKIIPLDTRRNGLDYLHDRSDTHARYADAPSGKWETEAPPPSLPSSKDIDQANSALDWLLLIPDEGLRKLLVVGATYKRGDLGRNINWPRVIHKLPEYRHMPSRTLRWRYREALRIIVSELTLAMVA